MENVAVGGSNKRKKLKATASMAVWLRIGSWERKEIYVGDVVGRCYYCSKKLVWEVMEGGWTGRIEFGWSKIIGMQAIVDHDNYVTVNVELKEPPIFLVEEQIFKAKKQATWLRSADFTEGSQASTFRRHSIRFKPGAFNEVYADLLNSDTRLLALTQKPFPTLKCPFFDEFSTELSNRNHFSAEDHSQPSFPVSSASLHLPDLTQWSPQIHQQLRFSSPSSSHVPPPPLQPSQHSPISSSFLPNVTPQPLSLPLPQPWQSIPPLHHGPTDNSSIESSYWQNEFGSSTNLSALPPVPPVLLRMSSPIADNFAPSPLQTNQQDLMNQQLHPSIDPLFHPISDNQNVLPNQTAGSSSSMTVFDDEMIDISWLLGGDEDATDVLSSSGDLCLWDMVEQILK